MRSFVLPILLTVSLCVAAAPATAQTRKPNNDVIQPGTPGFTLSSADIPAAAFAPAQIFNGFGCTGGNVSPAIAWRGAPTGTKSFVLTIFDPDAPTGSGFWHWVVANIPAATTGIARGASRTSNMPAGAIETRTDFGSSGYGGPCPPAGDAPHRYVFTLFALAVDHLDVTAESSGALVGFNTRAHVLGTATFTARYGR
jgi:Raf kinase inhibitor-like YbhB/YbcL family protein